MNILDTIYKFYCFFCIAFYAVGAIGGVGVTAYHHEWFIMVCVVALAAMAAPFMVERFKDLLA